MVVVAVVIIILMILLFIYVVWKVSSRKRKGRLLKIDDKPSDKKKDLSNPVTEKLDINSIPFDIEDKLKSNKEKYYDDLNDERWKRKREKILKRPSLPALTISPTDVLVVVGKIYRYITNIITSIQMEVGQGHGIILTMH